MLDVQPKTSVVGFKRLMINSETTSRIDLLDIKYKNGSKAAIIKWAVIKKKIYALPNDFITENSYIFVTRNTSTIYQMGPKSPTHARQQLILEPEYYASLTACEM